VDDFSSLPLLLGSGSARATELKLQQQRSLASPGSLHSEERTPTSTNSNASASSNNTNSPRASAATAARARKANPASSLSSKSKGFGSSGIATNFSTISVNTTTVNSTKPIQVLSPSQSAMKVPNHPLKSPNFKNLPQKQPQLNLPSSPVRSIPPNIAVSVESDSDNSPSHDSPAPLSNKPAGLRSLIMASAGSESEGDEDLTPCNKNVFGLKLAGFATVEDSVEEGEILLEDSEIAILGENEQGNNNSNANKARSKQERRGSFDISATGTFMARDFIIGETGVKGAPAPRAHSANNASNNSSGNNNDSNNGAICSNYHASTQYLNSNATKLNKLRGSNKLGMELRLEDLVRIGELGRGQTGTVVKAIHLPSLMIVALKTVNVFDKDERHQFIKELNAFNSASSPHILQFVGACFSEGKITMALEIMNRGSLDHAVKKFGKFNEKTLQNITKQALIGLNYLHSLHFLHRDIKPANMLVNNQGIVKISDFGLLKQLEDSQALSSTFVGTLLYLAPERITGDKFGYVSDVWSIGISIIYMALGRLDLPKDYWGLLNVLNKEAPRLETKQGFSAEMCEFVDYCLKKDPAERWSAEKLLQHQWLRSVDIDPRHQTHESWPFSVSTPPDEFELDILVDAVISRYYPQPDLFRHSIMDQARFQEIATQLGCHLKPVAEAFLKKLSPDSPASAYIITDKLNKTLSLRKSIATMADEDNMKPKPNLLAYSSDVARSKSSYSANSNVNNTLSGNLRLQSSFSINSDPAFSANSSALTSPVSKEAAAVEAAMIAALQEDYNKSHPSSRDNSAHNTIINPGILKIQPSQASKANNNNNDNNGSKPSTERIISLGSELEALSFEDD
jgi:serine/threonine protein kinase